MKSLIGIKVGFIIFLNSTIRFSKYFDSETSISIGEIIDLKWFLLNPLLRKYTKKKSLITLRWKIM
jgi:hypothetical protein